MAAKKQAAQEEPSKKLLYLIMGSDEGCLYTFDKLDDAKDELMGSSEEDVCIKVVEVLETYRLGLVKV